MSADALDLADASDDPMLAIAKHIASREWPFLLRSDMVAFAKAFLALTEEIQRLTDLRVRDAAYAAEREKDARYLIENWKIVGSPHWSYCANQ